MATYYWVGGTGSWNATTTTNWSLSSGGGGGAGVPTLADNVIFNSASNATAYTVNVGTNAVAADITIAGPGTGNVAITSTATSVINCYGSWLNAATGVAFSSTAGSALNFLATTTGKTVTTNNVTLGSLPTTFSGVGGGWTLGSAFTIASVYSVLAGSFSTNNFAVTASGLTSSGTQTRAINLGTSTITLSGATPINIANAANLTLNAGTSTITCSGAAPTFNGGGLTYYNVSFTGTTANSTTTILGANTFNNLNQTTPASGRRLIAFTVNQIINGTFTPGAANAYNRRVQLYSTGFGVPVTLTVATIAALSDVDFRDIVAAGASGTWSGTRLGNALGNANITFAASKTVYWNLVAGGNWSATAWAPSSGGTPATGNFPLAQDIAVIDDAGLTTSNAIAMDSGWWFGTLNCTRTNAWTLTNVNGPTIYGDFTVPSVTTHTGAGTYVFQGQGLTQTITTNGTTLTQSLTFSAVNGILLLNGAVTTATTATVTLNNGTLNLVTYTLTCGLFSSSGTSVRTIAFDAGKIVITSLNGIPWFTQTATNLTLTGTPRVEVSGVGTSISFTASCSGTALTTTGSPALAVGNIVISATGVSLGSISSGSGNSWVVSIGGTYASQTMTGVQQRTLDHGFTGGTEANSPNFYVTAGVDAISLTNQRKFGTVDFTGFAGYVSSDNWAFTVYGNFTLNSSILGFVTTSSYAGTLVFGATSGVKTVTTGGKTYLSSIAFDGVGGTWQLQDALTTVSTRTVTLNNGTLDMFNNTLTCGLFSSSGSTVRSVLFGTAQMYLTGNATTVWGALTATNFSYTGTGIVNCTYSGATGQRVIGHGSTGGTEANTPSFNVTAGTDNFAFNTNTRVKDLNFTGWGAGGVGLLTFNTLNVYGDLTLGIGSITSAVNAVIFVATSGSKTITSNGVIFNCSITFNGVGGTWQLADALSMAATKTIALVNGTFNANGQNVTLGIFISTGAAIRSLNLSSSTWTLLSAGAAWTVSGTNITLIDGSSTIFMSSSSPKTFAGGGLTYGNLYQSGVGDLTITGANTFNALVSLVAPTTVTTSANTVVTNFALSGSGANLVTFDGGSNTISQASGAVGPTNLLIKNSSAIGGAIWTAFPLLGNIDGGNNTGWIFTSPAPSGTGPGFFTIFD